MTATSPLFFVNIQNHVLEWQHLFIWTRAKSDIARHSLLPNKRTHFVVVSFSFEKKEENINFSLQTQLKSRVRLLTINVSTHCCHTEKSFTQPIYCRELPPATCWWNRSFTRSHCAHIYYCQRMKIYFIVFAIVCICFSLPSIHNRVNRI